MTISEREKEFVKINSLKGQLKELQEKLDDTANTHKAERAAIDKLLTTEKSQQIVELSSHLSARNVELETEVKEEECITTALDTNRGKILFCENFNLLDRKKGQVIVAGVFKRQSHVQKQHEFFKRNFHYEAENKTKQTNHNSQLETTRRLFR